MKMHHLLFAACLMAVGCNEPGPISGVRVLSPGRAMRLAYRCEMRTSRASGSVEEERHAVWPDTATQPHIVIKIQRIETPSKSVEWSDGELFLRVAAMPGSDNVRATMTVQRLQMGYTHHEQGEDREEEVVKFKQGPTTAPASSPEEGLEPLRDAEFIAVVDQAGRIVSVDATGKHWQDLKKESAKAVEKGSSQIPVDLAIQLYAPGVISSLADAMAYLPPMGFKPGESWQVLRENVVPHQTFASAMLMGGSVILREESICTLKAVRTGIRGKTAVVAVRGKRILKLPKRDEPERVKHLELTGELKVNLTTGAVEKLRLESIPMWFGPEEDESQQVKLVYVVSLKPA